MPQKGVIALATKICNDLVTASLVREKEHSFL